MRVTFTLNGRPARHEVEPRSTLAELLRDDCALTGLHLGCEHGSCGACTVLIDGAAGRSCLMLTALCEGRVVQTLEGLRNDPAMRVLKRSFHECHALQCGFCTPGMLMIAYDMIRRHAVLDEATVRLGLAGQICRCTGYVGIVVAILRAHVELHAASGEITP